MSPPPYSRVAVGEGGQRDGSVPPGDVADADRPGAAEDAHLRIAEALSHLRAEVRVDNLGVLVDEDEQLEVVELQGLLEEEVVVAEDRGRAKPRGSERNDLRVGLGDQVDAGLRAAVVQLVIGDCAAEGDHRCGNIASDGAWRLSSPIDAMRRIG